MSNLPNDELMGQHKHMTFVFLWQKGSDSDQIDLPLKQTENRFRNVSVDIAFIAIAGNWKLILDHRIECCFVSQLERC